MDTVLQQLINGLSLGAIYALIALGYTMVYGVLRLINFAHGDVYMLGAFAGYYLANALELDANPSILGAVVVTIGAMAICAAIGVLIERLAYRPVRHHSRLTSLITAIGVSLLLEYGGHPTTHVLGAIYQLGTILMVFLAGLEMRQGALGAERRTVLFTTVAGLVIPFAAGLALARAVDTGDLAGPHGSGMSISLVLGLAIAVTSIPVISRIMIDLGIMGSLFARTVLTVAVVEDVLLYVVLSVILGLAHVQADTSYGLHALFHTDSIGWDVAYYVAASLVFFAVCLAGGRAAFRWLLSGPVGTLEPRSPAAFRMVLLFILCLGCMGLGIDPIFGALMAGMAMAEQEDEETGSPGLSVVRGFSLAFFVPIYFALVGYRLDLVHDLDLFFFTWLFVLACVIKFGSVWAGARLSGKSRSWSTHFAVAMNARGGPGIVLASVTFGAGIINGKFLVALVLLSILTSQLAGAWLTRVLARDPAFVSGDPAFVSVEAPRARAEAMPGQRPGGESEGGCVEAAVQDHTDRMGSPTAGEGEHPKTE